MVSDQVYLCSGQAENLLSAVSGNTWRKGMMEEGDGGCFEG